MDCLPEGQLGNSYFRNKLPTSGVIPYPVHRVKIRLQARTRACG
jgi:hypothetical protein